MVILWGFFTPILEIGNLGNNIEDMGWSRATSHWCMDFWVSCLVVAAEMKSPLEEKLSQGDGRVQPSKNFSTELVAANPKHLGLADLLNQRLTDNLSAQLLNLTDLSVTAPTKEILGFYGNFMDKGANQYQFGLVFQVQNAAFLTGIPPD